MVAYVFNNLYTFYVNNLYCGFQGSDLKGSLHHINTEEANSPW